MKQKLATLLIIQLAVINLVSQTTVSDSEIKELAKLNQEVIRLFKEGKFSEAIPVAKKAVESTEKNIGANTLEMALALTNLGYVQFSFNDTKAGENSLEKAIKIYKKLPNLDKNKEEILASIYEKLAINKQKKEFTFAESDLEDAAVYREKVSGADAKELISTYFFLANISYWRKDYKKSAERYKKVLEIIDKNKNTNTDDSTFIYYRCKCALIKAGKENEAEVLKQRFFTPSNSIVKVGLKVGDDEVINGKAIDLVKPPYPQEAKNAQASGTVKVEVLINKTGNVIYACSEKSEIHTALKESSEIAALNSKFSPTTVNGKSVNVTGTIVYNFSRR